MTKPGLWLGKGPISTPFTSSPWSAEVPPVGLGLAKTQLGHLNPPPVVTAGTHQGVVRPVPLVSRLPGLTSLLGTEKVD